MRLLRPASPMLLAALLAGCGQSLTSTPEGAMQHRDVELYREFGISDESFFDLFRDRGNPDQGVVVNRYLWQASLDVLSFLPLETADPFSGIITTGWGSIAGAGAYRVTVYISQPALDATSLKVAAFRGGGGAGVPVTEAQNRAIEDAILTRARQLRIAGSGRGTSQDYVQQQVDLLVPGR